MRMGGGHDMYGGGHHNGGVKGFVSNLVHGGQGHGHGHGHGYGGQGYPPPGAYPPPAHGGYPSHGYAPAAYPSHGAPHGHGKHSRPSAAYRFSVCNGWMVW